MGIRHVSYPKCSRVGYTAVQALLSNWTTLVTRVMGEIPEARGRILLDLINEPDGFGFRWCVDALHASPVFLA
jgi:hypothetical protein